MMLFVACAGNKGSAELLNIKNKIVAKLTVKVLFMNPILTANIAAVNCKKTKGQEAFLDS